MSVGAKALGGLKRHLSSYREKRGWFWPPIETLAISAIAIGLGYVVMGGQITAIQTAFPWLLLFPLLVALRYRSFYGLICNVLIVVFFTSMAKGEITWFSYLVGSSCATLLVGEFSHSWFMRNRRTEELLRYTKTRLDSLSRAHYLAQLSHQHLEQSMITKPVTLRQIVADIRKATIYENGQLNKDSLSLLLTLLSRYCGLVSAGIYASEKGKISKTGLIHIGEEFSLDTDDLLLKKLEAIKAVRYQTIEKMSDTEKSNYLAVVPLTTTESETIAYLVIQDMLFSFVNEETMQTLSVILSYYANDVSGSRAGKDILAVYPDCPIGFACELKHMTGLSKQLSVESHLMSIFIEKSDRSSYLVKKLEQIHRGLDYGWLIEDEGKYTYLNLMPFSGSNALVGYINRLNKWLKEEFGLQFDGALCGYRAYQLTNLAPVELIKKALQHD
jgi:hypothetical protein